MSIIFISLLVTSGMANRKTDSIRVNTIHSDTTTIISNTNSEITDDFNPGLGIFAFIFFCIVAFCIGAGAIAAFILFVLVSMSIVSGSVIVGLYNRSFTKGFKTFWLSTLTVGGLGVGLIGIFVINWIFYLHFTIIQLLAIGVTCGLLSGIILGLISIKIARKLISYLKSKQL